MVNRNKQRGANTGSKREPHIAPAGSMGSGAVLMEYPELHGLNGLSSARTPPSPGRPAPTGGCKACEAALRADKQSAEV